MSRPFQEERNSQDLWMGLERVSEVVSVRRCAKSVKRKARDPHAVESGQPEGERVISASSPVAPRQFLTTKPWCAAVYGPARTTTRHIRSEVLVLSPRPNSAIDALSSYTGGSAALRPSSIASG